jgi:hypothetical protein
VKTVLHRYAAVSALQQQQHTVQVQILKLTEPERSHNAARKLHTSCKSG